jgi:hypothetical protein
MGRNTAILTEIIKVLGDRIVDKEASLIQLEEHFMDRLIVDAGNTETVATFARRLRLRVAPDERQAILDYIASKGMVSINIDVVEEAVNSLLGEDRFIEPES